jgi:two-component system nitrogen regulation response regulator GlnG
LLLELRMSARTAAESFEAFLTDAVPALVSEASAGGGRIYRAVMARMELPLLRHVLERCDGNQLRAAKLLGINRNTLRKRLRLLGLLPPSERTAARTARPA